MEIRKIKVVKSETVSITMKKLGKNQKALLHFLEKYPNKWHSIKGRKAYLAAYALGKRGIIALNIYGQVSFQKEI